MTLTGSAYLWSFTAHIDRFVSSIPYLLITSALLNLAYLVSVILCLVYANSLRTPRMSSEE